MATAVNQDSLPQTHSHRNAIQNDFLRRVRGKNVVEGDSTYRQGVDARNVEETESGESAGGKTRDSPLSDRDDLFSNYLIFE